MTGDEKRAFLTLVAYGIHSTFQKNIRISLEQEFGIRSFFIYEYLLDQPIVKNAEGLSVSAFQPFLLRILNELKFIPKITDAFPDSWTEIERLPYTHENITAFLNFASKGSRITNINNSFIGREIFDLWKSEFSEKPNRFGWLLKEKNSNFVKGNFSYPINYLRRQYLSEIKEFDEISRNGMLKEYMVSVHPWLSCADIDYMNISVLR